MGDSVNGMMNNRFALSLLVCSALLVAATSAMAGAHLTSFTVTTSGGLFTSVGTPGTSGANTVWPVTVDTGLLSSLPASVVVNFPDRAAATLSRDRSELRGSNGFLWTGRGNGCSGIFSSAGNGFRGVISCLNAPYGVDIVAAGSGLQLIRFGQPTAPAAVESSLTNSAPISSPNPAQATPTSADQAIDILVLYTEPVRQSLVALGLDPVKYMHDAVDTTQQAMVNSTATNVGQPLIAQLNFVAAKKVLYSESGDFGADLFYLANDPEPKGLRDYWAADVVVLVTESGTPNACGQARRPNDGGLPPPGLGYAPFAHAVVKRTCSISQVVFPHEFAHTLGADHNAESEHNATPLHPWAYAHWAAHPGGGARTIMSYLISACTAPCIQVLNYSNPDVMVEDWFVTGKRDTQDNARIIQEFAPPTALYRTSLGRIFADGFQ